MKVSRRQALPRPLMALLAVVFLTTTAWSVFNPAFQVPDEPQHLGYVESLAENGKRPEPTDTTGAGYRDDLSTVTDRFRVFANTYSVAFDLYARHAWGETAERRYEAEARKGSRKDGGGATGASQYPPLYYAVETIPYKVASSGTAMDRVYLMRWFSGLWVLATAVGAWLLAGEVFKRNRLAQLVTAATLGLWPMISFMSAAINPDAMLFGLSAFILWLLVRIGRHGTTPWPAVALVALVVAASLTKVSAVAFAPAALLAIVAGLPRVRARTGDRPLRLLGLAVALFALPVAALLGLGATGHAPGQLALFADLPDPKRFASYLWQFYLPQTDWLTPQRFHIPVISQLPLYNIWLGTSWGVYGWIIQWFPDWAYKVFLAISLVVLAGAAWTFARAWRRTRQDSMAGRSGARVTIVLGVAAVAILAGVHLQDYANGIGGGLPFAQGRYLFPVAGIGGLAVAGAVVALPRRMRPVAATAWLGFLVVFQLGTLALIAGRFYA